MNIIFVSGNSARRTILLSRQQSWLVLGALIGVPIALATFFYYLTLNIGALANVPAFRHLVLEEQRKQAERQHLYVQQNLDAMAVKLGEMQAQLTRVDAVGERLAKTAGFQPQEFGFGSRPGQGGAERLSAPGAFTLEEFNAQMDEVARALEERADRLAILDAMLSGESVKQSKLPSGLPLHAQWSSSSYGWRIDPFTGRKAFHEGIDFVAPQGTPIQAAAGGVVVYSNKHHDYGNMVEIDHGNGLVSRYAHAATLLVKEGDIVLKGQQVATVGSTGRSTGPHLHFEVRFKGVAQNPARFLHRPG